jgi:hypothetical protein
MDRGTVGCRRVTAHIYQPPLHPRLACAAKHEDPFKQSGGRRHYDDPQSFSHIGLRESIFGRQSIPDLRATPVGLADGTDGTIAVEVAEGIEVCVTFSFALCISLALSVPLPVSFAVTVVKHTLGLGRN